MTKIRRFCTISISLRILFFCFLTLGSSFAQDEPLGPTPPRQPPLISFEALPFFSTDSSVTLVNIHYRIREDFFVVLRNIESLSPNDFVARGDLLIELYNQEGISVKRNFRSIVLQKTRIPSEDDRASDLQGSVSFNVPPGTYTVLFNVEDRQSERSFTSRDQTVTTRLPRRSQFDISPPVLVLPPVQNDSTSFTVLNRGNDVLFGANGGILHAALAPQQSPVLSVRYVVVSHPEIAELGRAEFRGGSFVMAAGLPTLLHTAGDTLSLAATPVRYFAEPSREDWKTVYVALPFGKLYPGRAKVTIDFDLEGVTKSLETSFNVLWPDRPMALSDLDLAVDALQHIATEEEMKSFRSFSRTSSVQHFFEFWKKKDPDTTTAYNELMVEYYRRVDGANRQYSVGNDLNGYKTDRGRIYILYGSPGSSQRLFSPMGPPKEVWTYPNLKRRFVFEDRRGNGNYSLVSVEDI